MNLRSLALALLVCLLAACGAAPVTLSPSASATQVAPTTSAPSTTEAETPPATQAFLPASFGDPNAYSWQPVVGGFEMPLLVTHAGDGSGRLFVVEQAGIIYVVENGVRLSQPFLDIRSRVGSRANEQGLLGLAFHPDVSTGYFYLNYTDLNGDTVISRFQISANPNQANPDSELMLLLIPQPYSNHNGGHLAFGPEGHLYIGLGDGGDAGDPLGNGQSLQTLLGKLLRIAVNSPAPYAIPHDNPFVSGQGLPEIWAYGLRNPWRFSFDRATGDLYIADVGQGQIEEINVLPAGSGAGANLGWSYFEGTATYRGSAPEGMQFVSPVAQYDHSGRCSVTGGYVYRGAVLPAWNGVYFYGDFCSGEVLGLYQAEDGSWVSGVLWDTSALITSFGEDEAGEIYLVDRNGGIYQLQANN